ncbi:MAG: hydrogenase maturation nickel metallochaperone HypA [Candidatus Omnitrophica bacterium]|nr:hydrogenase maturation nickel metallochaperone HypA [Candidatus Omnitrophota bacterium]
MHEIGLVDDILRAINAKLKGSENSKIKCVNILIGELEHVTPEHFEFHFRERVRGTHFESAKLNFTKAEAKFKCKSCGCEFSAKEGFSGCPDCGSKINDIISGSGVCVESVEIV